MKTYRYIFLLFYLLLCHGVNAQFKCQDNPYILWVSTSQNIELKGNLHSAKDSSIMFHEGNHFSASYDIDSRNILQLKYRKKKQKGNAMKIGAAAGLITGIVIAAGDQGRGHSFSYVDTEVIVHFTTVLFTTGLGLSIGLGLGSKSEKIKINGNQKSYDAIRKDLERFQCNE